MRSKVMHTLYQLYILSLLEPHTYTMKVDNLQKQVSALPTALIPTQGIDPLSAIVAARCYTGLLDEDINTFPVLEPLLSVTSDAGVGDKKHLSANHTRTWGIEPLAPLIIG